MLKIKVRGVVRKGESIYLVKVCKGDFFCLPGGTYEGGETFRECLKRECIEELGVTPEIGECILMREFKNDQGESLLDVWFEVLNASDFENADTIHSSHGYEISEAGFYTPDQILARDVRPKNLQEMLKSEKRFLFL